jgi:hypothetical protein
MDKLKVSVKVVEKTRPIRSFAASSPTSLTEINVPDLQTKIQFETIPEKLLMFFSNIFVVFALQVM